MGRHREIVHTHAFQGGPQTSTRLQHSCFRRVLRVLRLCEAPPRNQFSGCSDADVAIRNSVRFLPLIFPTTRPAAYIAHFMLYLASGDQIGCFLVFSACRFLRCRPCARAGAPYQRPQRRRPQYGRRQNFGPKGRRPPIALLISSALCSYLQILTWCVCVRVSTPSGSGSGVGKPGQDYFASGREVC